MLCLLRPAPVEPQVARIRDFLVFRLNDEAVGPEYRVVDSQRHKADGRALDVDAIATAKRPPVRVAPVVFPVVVVSFASDIGQRFGVGARVNRYLRRQERHMPNVIEVRVRDEDAIDRAPGLHPVEALYVG